MQQSSRGGITWILGTLAALVGLVLALDGGSDSRVLGGVLVIAGVLLRIEAAVLGLRSGSIPAADESPRRPWQRSS